MTSTTARPRAMASLVLAASSALTLLSGCAGNYVARTQDFRRTYEAGEPALALQVFETEEKKAPKIDRLLVLLDKGMVLHAAGRWEESIQVLAEADRLSQELDVVSVSEEAAALLTNERERAYRGEDFEKLMISVLQALNYAQLGKDEDALVEVRRVNERIKKMVDEEKKPYEQLAIARYLGGALWEDQGELDSAFIDYYQAYKLNPKLGYLAEPLLRLAKKTERDDVFRELSEKFKELDSAPLSGEEGQVVVVVEHGLSPEKQKDVRRSDLGRVVTNVVPVYKDRWRGGNAYVAVGEQERQALTVTSLEQVAKIHLDDRVGRMIAKSVAGAVVKAGVAAGVGALTRSGEVGALTFVLLSLFNQPDLRSWLSLPAEFQVARFRLPAGEHQVSVKAAGQTTRHSVKVRPRRVSFVVVRRY